MHNGGCVKEETNYHFNCVIRLGKLPFVLFAQIVFFFRSFFPYSWNGQWNNRPLRSCDMNSLLEKLVGKVIKMPLRLKFALCVSKNLSFFPLRVRSQGFNEGKYQLGGWIYWWLDLVGFVVVLLHKYLTCHYCCSKEDFKVVDKHLARNLSSRTIYFPVASNHVKALGLR